MEYDSEIRDERKTNDEQTKVSEFLLGLTVHHLANLLLYAFEYKYARALMRMCYFRHHIVQSGRLCSFPFPAQRY
jgi:hypothetical protein